MKQEPIKDSGKLKKITCKVDHKPEIGFPVFLLNKEAGKVTRTREEGDNIFMEAELFEEYGQEVVDLLKSHKKISYGYLEKEDN